MKTKPNQRSASGLTTYGFTIALFGLTWLVFLFSPVHQITDSSYSMLLSQNLLEHRSFKLDSYALPRLEPMNRGYYISNGSIYQLERANGHVYYQLPPGTSILSVPYVALMKLFGVMARNADGTYNPQGEETIEISLAALLMATFTVLSFFSARLLLPVGWSTVVAIFAAFGTQVWSTASRAMWSDAWGIVIIGIVVLMLLAREIGKRTLNPFCLATLLAWSYFVRPTNAVTIIAVSIYVALYHRQVFWRFALTGAAWFGGFVFYTWYNYRRFLPSYYQSERLNFSVFWTAIAGNLVSPARGLLVYVPALLFVGYVLARYWKDVRLHRLAVLALSICAGHIFIISTFPHWWGGHSYGPRFTTGLVPWLVLFSILATDALVIQHKTSPRRRFEPQLMIGGLLLILTIGINARGALSHRTWWWNVTPIDIDANPERLWDWREPQFLAGWVRPPIPRDFPIMTGKIDFTSSAAEKYLWYGWSSGEEEYRWTDDKQAAVVFGLNTMSDYDLTMEFGGFLGRGKISEQRVSVSLNGQWLQTFVLEDEGADVYRLPLRKDLLRYKNVLTFDIPNANSPRKLDLSTDARDLGISMHWLELQQK